MVLILKALCLLFLAFCIGCASIEQVRIMPLGDSITVGSASGVSDPDYMVSYRKMLWDQLFYDGYEVDFVGSENNGSAVFADLDLADHEGHHGWRDDQIANRLEDWLISAKPNVVLLHIGTNGLDTSPNDVEDILDIIDNYENNSGEAVYVILARIINRSNYSKNTTEFNDNIEAVVNERIGNPSDPAFPDKVIIVDMEDGAGINYGLVSDDLPGDMWDNLHPFETGYAKMADAWLSGLRTILPVADAGSNQNQYEGMTVTLDASSSFDPDGSIVSYLWEQQPGSPPIYLSDVNAEKPTFIAPQVGPDGESLTIKVTVTDNDGLKSTATSSVFVLNDF